MEKRLKQRLVGAIVLVSLAVVFVPILFDTPREVDERTSTVTITRIQIPDRPPDQFGSSAGGTPDAPQTTRLDAEVERERDLAASSAAPGAASDSSGAAVSTEVPDVSGQPAEGKPDDGAGKERDAEAPAGSGWTVQLGSFTESENALALRKRLQARGYPAFVESGPSAQGEVSRVLVGPMPDRKQADDSAAKLRREMDLKGIVVPYPGG